MKRNVKIKSLIAILVLFALTPLAITPSSAMTMPKTYWPGSSVSGAEISKDSGIVVEKQTVRFDLGGFPAYDDTTKIGEYAGTVTTEYTLFNPTEQDITVRLTVPHGGKPSYYYEVTQVINAPRPVVTIDGSAADVTVRHRLWYDTRDPRESFFSGISDEYLSTDRCNPNTTVTKYTFKQSGVELLYSYAAFDLDPKLVEGASCVYIESNPRALTQDDGKYRINIPVGENGWSFDVYVIGKDFESFPEWTIYEDGAVKDGDEIAGTIGLVKKETLLLSDFIFSLRDAESEISRVDWFNMATNEITATMNNGGVHTTLSYTKDKNESRIISGSVYEVTIGAGKRVVNTISTLIYPSAEERFNPPVFDYTYCLPFETLLLTNDAIDVTVNTPFYMIEGSSEFTKTESGYTMSLQDTQDGEFGMTQVNSLIQFSLCESESPEEVKTEIPAFFWILLILAIPFIAVIAIVELVVDVVGWAIEGIKGLIA